MVTRVLPYCYKSTVSQLKLRANVFLSVRANALGVTFSVYIGPMVHHTGLSNTLMVTVTRLAIQGKAISL